MYPGGKNIKSTFQFIINQFPPHRVYIEGFLGSGAIMKNKRPAEVNIRIECDRAVINRFHICDKTFYRVINGRFTEEYAKLAANAEADTFIYLDPPYPLSSRSNSQDLYKYEMTDDDHRELLLAVMHSKARIAISTYPNDIYSEMLKDWRVLSFRAYDRMHNEKKELLYMNYPVPEALHDYRYLGTTKTKKQNIRRKIEREVKKLKAMPPYERQAIIEAIRSGVDLYSSPAEEL